MQKGSIEEFTKKTNIGFSGIKLSGSLTTSSANADKIQNRTNISTASTRASDATADMEWIMDDEEILDQE